MRRPRATTLRLTAMTAASATVTAACGISHVGTTSGLALGPTGTPITVGISEPLSGPAQAQGFEADGQACLKGYELWASDVNSHGGLLGHPVKLIVMNDRGWPASTAYDYKWLITHDHVDLTLAPFSSLLTHLGAEPVTKQYGYALAAGQAGAPTVYGPHNLFSTNVPVEFQLEPFAKWVLTLGPRLRPQTAAYPIVNNPFAVPPVQRAQKILEAGGIRTVYNAPSSKKLGVGYNNLSPAALKADARQVAASRAQMVVLGSVDVPTVAAFVKDFIAQSYTPKIFVAAAGPDQGQAFLNAVGTGNAIGMMVPNGWYAGTPIALSRLMVQDYIARYGGSGSTINADVAESYSAGEVLAAAVRATGVTASGGTNQAKIIAWLHQNSMQTVLGKVAFNNIGQNKLALNNAALIFQWQAPPSGGAPQFVQVLPPNKPGDAPIKPNWAG
jgi:branched-chain amino acid transport system substrate-binding protein